jgi:hypothetical protein
MLGIQYSSTMAGATLAAGAILAETNRIAPL